MLKIKRYNSTKHDLRSGKERNKSTVEKLDLNKRGNICHLKLEGGRLKEAEGWCWQRWGQKVKAFHAVW